MLCKNKKQYHGEKSLLDILKHLAEFMLNLREDFVKAFAEDIGVARKVGEKEVEFTCQYLATMDEELPWIEGRRPYGKVAGILPYDASTMMFARIAGSALIGGNRAVVSFSSLTPNVRDLVREAVDKAGAPVEVNTTCDNRTFGEICCKDQSVRVFFVSGGEQVGSLFESRAHMFDKLIFAGPSGMPPALVMPGASVEDAALFVARRAFLNGGQYCTTIKKVLVYAAYFDDFMDRLLELVDGIKVGDPLDPETDYGPIKARRTRVLLERAFRIIRGDYVRGGVIDGEWVPPTVVVADAPLPDIELFGPFLAVRAVEDPEAIVEEAVSTRYGHIIYVFGDITERQREKIEANFGMCHYNPDFLFLPLRGPYGGKKEAGWIIENRGGTLIKRDGPIIYSVEMTWQ